MNKSVVIMSVYKNDKLEHVKECLESLYNQTYKDFDIFLQCDGVISQDLFKHLENEFKNRKISYLGVREVNKGLAYSLNELIKIGLEKDYEYFFRMDADDICNLERFERQIDFMENNKNIDICGTYIEEFGDGIKYNKIVKYPLTHEEMFNFFKKRVPMAHPTVCFRKSFFEKAGLYPETNHISNEDTLMWMKGFKNNCVFANLTYIGVKMRVSNAFFNRRNSYKKVLMDFKNRLEVIKTLEYGIDSYFYAMGITIVNLLPPKIKKYAYKLLR